MLARPLIAQPAGTTVEVVSADLGATVGVERRADLVAVLRRQRRARRVVVVEVQLRRDPEKRWRWPAYLCAARDVHRCDAQLVVIAPDRRVARWCRTPIHLGPSGRVVPSVLGPDDIPRITERTPAAPVELAVLSALAHGRADARVARATLDAIGALVDADRQRQYTTVVLDVIGETMRERLEKDMKLEYYPEPTPLEQRYLERGRAMGLAEAVLQILRARGLPVGPEVEGTVRGCSDVTTLQQWLGRATDCASAEILLAANEPQS